ncbi:MAG: GNAT family N-acetyltransferase [Gilvibacter sp.]
MGISTLHNDHVLLRALEPEDLEFLYRLENDETIWEVSNTQTPYSKFVLKQYLENAHKDIYEVKQLRLAIISKNQKELVGFIDLFDFDPKNARVGIGVVIYSDEQRNKGYAKNALGLLLGYCENNLQMHQVYANIGAGNKASLSLFESLGFSKSGHKKDWLRQANGFTDELIYQKIYES